MKQYLQNVLGLFKGIFSSTLKDNIYLKKGIVTGILPIVKARLFSGVNNLEEYTILNNNFSEHFGFTEEEVIDVIQRSRIGKIEELMEKIKEWYNGYRIGDNTIYNPRSIMKMIQARGNPGILLDGYRADPGLLISTTISPN